MRSNAVVSQKKMQYCIRYVLMLHIRSTVKLHDFNLC
jgi:hypothetical protein